MKTAQILLPAEMKEKIVNGVTKFPKNKTITKQFEKCKTVQDLQDVLNLRKHWMDTKGLYFVTPYYVINELTRTYSLVQKTLNISELFVEPLTDTRKPIDNELVNDVKLNGVLMPIKVKQTQNGYMVVDGVRRFKAATIAQLQTVPVLVVTQK